MDTYERVVIKLGGGLITNKTELCSPRIDRIKELGRVIGRVKDSGISVVIVHGAGSYGHIIAREWRLHEGFIPDFDALEGQKQKSDSDSRGIHSQEDAVRKVREDMIQLNSVLLEEWGKLGLEVESFPAHKLFTETGPNYVGSLSAFDRKPCDPIPITFGDVVDCKGAKKFGILSGDDLVVRLSKELPNVCRLVFAVFGVDGILRRPPRRRESEGGDKDEIDTDLIEVFDPKSVYEAEHATKIDVTGGIGYKAMSGLLVAQSQIPVVLVRGENSSRVLAACKGEAVRGTKIAPIEN